NKSRYSDRRRRRHEPCAILSRAPGPPAGPRGTIFPSRHSIIKATLLRHGSLSQAEQFMSVLPDWPRNRLLLALPGRVRAQLMPSLEPIECEREQVLIDADTALDHVYFPDSGVISVVAVYPDGAIIEMATIGREGATG